MKIPSNEVLSEKIFFTEEDEDIQLFNQKIVPKLANEADLLQLHVENQFLDSIERHFTKDQLNKRVFSIYKRL